MFSLSLPSPNVIDPCATYKTSASDSALIATVAARSRYIREHPHVAMEKLVLYTTTQTHSLGKKAGLVLGLKVRALEVTAADDFALRGETLEVALKEDVDAGLHPFILGIYYHGLYIVEFTLFVFVVATIGTTSSGAVDRLGEIADVGAYTDHVLGIDESSSLHAAKNYPFLWLHVDAAWAGVALVCPEYREACQLSAINTYADSFCTNFHKVCFYLVISA